MRFRLLFCRGGLLLLGRHRGRGLGADIGDDAGGLVRLSRGRQRRGLVDVFVYFRRWRRSGDNVDIDGHGVLIDVAARARQRDQQGQKHGKADGVDDAGANRKNREIDFVEPDPS
jgi:hypothetical protein